MLQLDGVRSYVHADGDALLSGHNEGNDHLGGREVSIGQFVAWVRVAA